MLSGSTETQDLKLVLDLYWTTLDTARVAQKLMVSYQSIGQLGNVDNGIVTVFGGYVAW